MRSSSARYDQMRGAADPTQRNEREDTVKIWTFGPSCHNAYTHVVDSTGGAGRKLFLPGSLLSSRWGMRQGIWVLQAVLRDGTSIAGSNFHNYGICQKIFMDLKDAGKAKILRDFSPLKGLGKMPAQRERGTTLVEVAVAGALLVLGLTSLYALYGTTVNTAKAGDSATIAGQNSIARIDQMRNLTWNNTTSPSAIAALLLTPTSSDNASTISKEVIKIYPAAVPQTSPLPAPTPSPSPTPGSTPFFSVSKIGAGTPEISPSTPGSILSERLIRVEVTTEWITSTTTHQRQLSTLISKSGTKTR
jgi:type II secretory pathway pseudopilin PulG